MFLPFKRSIKILCHFYSTFSRYNFEKCCSFLAMILWLTLIFVTSVAAGPPYRKTIPDILQLPPWDSVEETDVEIINVPLFQRDAVEGPPTIDSPSLDPAITHEDYGSRRFPLRDAVEALPSNKIDSQVDNLPLQNFRESVFIRRNITYLISI